MSTKDKEVAEPQAMLCFLKKPEWRFVLHHITEGVEPPKGCVWVLPGHTKETPNLWTHEEVLNQFGRYRPYIINERW